MFRKGFNETGWWEAELGRLLITDPENRILGMIVFLKPSTFRDTYEIGFLIFKPEDRGQGYMTEAVSLFVPYLFELKNVSRIESTTLSENVAAQQVFKKCGFKHEGTLRQTLFHRGQFKDMEIFSILRNETDSLSRR